MSLTFSSRPIPAPANPDMAKRNLERWREAIAAEGELQEAVGQAIEKNEKAEPLMAAIFGGSPFLSHAMIQEPALFGRFLAEGPDGAFDFMIQSMTDAAQGAAQPALMKAMRRGKRQMALIVGAADLGGFWDLDQVTGALTRFADLTLAMATAHLLRQAHDKGDIVLPDPERPETDCGVMVLGMGKLGAYELNYSSDIDIIVFYDPDKIVYKGRRSVQEWTIQLTRDLVRLIDERTQDGYVFRTDLRLRPDPGSTPPAVSIIAAETYYESFGQNWERAAMIKVRQCAGDRIIGDAFLKFLKPFIWRKHLDFAAIQDIHSIKRQINAHRGGGKIAVAGHNIKLGRGGIREIEFFAQTQQLIWGGRQLDMRSPRTLDALDALAEAGHITAEANDDLHHAYRFLRDVEHRLQMIDDQQTQTLPSDDEKLKTFSIFMGFDGADSFADALRFHMQKVERHYAHLFEDAPVLAPTGNLVFTGDSPDPETLKTLTEMGFNDPITVASQIKGWHHGRARATRTARAREFLTELTPSLLQALAKASDPDAAFRHFDRFLFGMPAGIAFFSLFVANPKMLDFLAEIMGSAPRIADMLSARPTLVDDALSPGFFDSPPDLAHLIAEMDQALLQSDDNFEEMLDASRRWVNEKKFRIAVMTMRNLLTPMQIGEQMTNIAEAAVSRVDRFVSKEFKRLHGGFKGPGHALIAMGKMGSREMSASSDLDLILIYDQGEEFASSDGAKPLEGPVYFGRLTQRVINAISAKTAEGSMYEVDMRLRPSGNSGPIATSIKAFEHYQTNLAWTWEHMALTRARIIGGAPELCEAIEAIIKKTLLTKRDPDRLAADAHEMRERIYAAYGSEDFWSIKHKKGGLVDLEFIVQFLKLRDAADHPEILAVTTADSLAKIGEAGLIPTRFVERLTETINLYQAIVHVMRQTLNDSTFDEKTAPQPICALLAQIAGLPSFEMLKLHLTEAALDTRRIYETLIGDPGRAWIAQNPKIEK